MEYVCLSLLDSLFCHGAELQPIEIFFFLNLLSNLLKIIPEEDKAFFLMVVFFLASFKGKKRLTSIFLEQI